MTARAPLLRTRALEQPHDVLAASLAVTDSLLPLDQRTKSSSRALAQTLPALESGVQLVDGVERPLASGGDDYVGDPSTTGVVTPGGSNNGIFETADDSDWFAITLQVGQQLIITTNANPTRPLIAFYDAAGNPLPPALVREEGSSFVYALVAPTTGTYFVAASQNTTVTPLGYSFGAQVFPADDFAANTSTVGTLDSGSATGTFEHIYDTDWFAITLDTGQSIDITGPGWLTHIRFYDAAGNPIEVDFLRAFNNGATLQTAGFTAAVAGIYYVSVAGIGTGSTYTLTTQERTTPHPNDVDTFVPVTTSGLVQGVLGASGQQWFSVHLEAGQSIHLDELETQVYSAYGQSMSPHHGVDETQEWFTTFTASEAGTYYFATSGTPGSTYQIATLIYTDDAPDGLPPLNGETFPVLNTSGQVVNGHTEIFDDDDYFAFNLAAGETVRIRLEFTDPHSLSSDLRIFAWNGHLWDTYYGQHESVGFSEIVFTAPTNGAYYVGFDGLYRYVGDYTLTLTPATPADAYDGEPSILPALPAQPTTVNVASTTTYSSGTHTVDAGTVLYAVNLIDNSYFAPYGSPIIHASNHPFANPTLNNAGVIYSYTDTDRPLA